ncbi:aminodeoxychorismate synthase component I [Thermoflexus hugenholtzii]
MQGDAILWDERASRWLRFCYPLRVIEVTDRSDVLPALHEVERSVREKELHAVGWVAYEAAPAWDGALRVRPSASSPLLWFGLYRDPEPIDLPRITSRRALGPWRPLITEETYREAILRIKDYIERGDTYQVNYTFPLCAFFRGDPFELFVSLVRSQRPRYPVYLDAGRYVVCSASPELFFRRNGSELVSRPMKGTAPRGRTWQEDQMRAERMRTSEKERAENVMIVDMVRNDMGRIARLGTVRVAEIFEVERYPTLLQMTSTVRSETDASLVDIFGAMFPAASITGAPKVRTMEIIAELEAYPRGIYTGAIGWIAPDLRAQFNVAIRTVVVDRERQVAIFGVGGGVVWDSEPEREYRECLLKARILTEEWPDFDLLESMRWEPRIGYLLLERHLRRLAESACYFDFPYDEMEVRRVLEECAARLPLRPHKIRLQLSQEGSLKIQALPLEQASLRLPLRLGRSRDPVDSQNPFLYHKTTHRAIYEEARAARPDCDDVLLWNEKGEATESSMANLVVRMRGEWITPPVACGLLPGTLRGALLERGVLRERPINVTELALAEEIYLINSVRGWMQAIWLG